MAISRTNMSGRVIAMFKFVGEVCLILCSLSFMDGVVMGQQQSDSLWSFQSVRINTSLSGDTLDHIGDEVTVSGIANIQTGLLHEHYLQAFIQNDSAGISLFGSKIDTPFEVGDSIVAKGKIQRYNGLVEVGISSYYVFPDVSKGIAPKALKKAVYNPEQYLGMLVEGKGTIIEKGTIYNGKYLRISPSDSTKKSIMVYVSNFHHLYEKFEFDVLSIGDQVRVSGIVSEYDPEFPDQRTYKVFLRTPEDLQYAVLPRYYFFLVTGGSFLLACLVGIWIVALRRQVDKKTEQIQDSLEEKKILLKEIHHRVKNNLSIISGLIELQMDNVDNEIAKDVLKNSQSRIHSMALIHEKLYQNKTLSEVKLDSYLRELVTAIHETFTEFESVDLKFDLEAADISIDKVIPCGLLVNELVVNAFKHAFSIQRYGTLEVKLHQNNGKIKLTIADNGPGLPEDFSLEGGDSLGKMLISTFASQLEASSKVTNGEKGATFTFTFSVN